MNYTLKVHRCRVHKQKRLDLISWCHICILDRFSFPLYTVIALFLTLLPQNYHEEAISKTGVLKQGLFLHAPYSDAWVRENCDWLAWANNNIGFNLDVITCKMNPEIFKDTIVSLSQFSRGSSVSFRNSNQERCGGATFSTGTKRGGRMQNQRDWRRVSETGKVSNQLLSA